MLSTSFFFPLSAIYLGDDQEKIASDLINFAGVIFCVSIALVLCWQLLCCCNCFAPRMEISSQKWSRRQRVGFVVIHEGARK